MPINGNFNVTIGNQSQIVHFPHCYKFSPCVQLVLSSSKLQPSDLVPTFPFDLKQEISFFTSLRASQLKDLIELAGGFF